VIFSLAILFKKKRLAKFDNFRTPENTKVLATIARMTDQTLMTAKLQLGPVITTCFQHCLVTERQQQNDVGVISSSTEVQ
jgi:hypothetical protein